MIEGMTGKAKMLLKEPSQSRLLDWIVLEFRWEYVIAGEDDASDAGSVAWLNWDLVLKYT
jgi:hypothetical protein